jgi:hypothetical protein
VSSRPTAWPPTSSTCTSRTRGARSRGSRRRTGTPSVVTYHSDIVRQKAALELYKPFLRACSTGRPRHRVVAQHGRALRVPRPRSDKCRVVPFGIDVDEFASTPEVELRAAELREGHDRPIVLFVGRLIYYKGADVLVRAMARHRRRPRHHRLRPARVRDCATIAAAEAACSDRVTFLGGQPFDELVAWYHAADVFCLPSVARSEAFGLVQIEAHARARRWSRPRSPPACPSPTRTARPVWWCRRAIVGAGRGAAHARGGRELRARYGARASSAPRRLHHRAHGRRHARRLPEAAEIRARGERAMRRRSFIALALLLDALLINAASSHRVLVRFGGEPAGVQLQRLPRPRAGHHARLSRGRLHLRPLRARAHRERLGRCPRGVLAVTLGAVLTAAISFFGGPRFFSFSRLAIVIGWAFDIALLVGWRLAFMRMAPIRWPEQRVLIVGTGTARASSPTSCRAARAGATGSSGFLSATLPRPAGAPAGTGDRRPAAPRRSTTRAPGRRARHRPRHRRLPGRAARLHRAPHIAEELDVRVDVVPELYEVFIGTLDSVVADIPLMEITRTGAPRWYAASSARRPRRVARAARRALAGPLLAASRCCSRWAGRCSTCRSARARPAPLQTLTSSARWCATPRRHGPRARRRGRCAHHAGRPLPAHLPARRAAAARQHPPRRDEFRGPRPERPYFVERFAPRSPATASASRSSRASPGLRRYLEIMRRLPSASSSTTSSTCIIRRLPWTCRSSSRPCASCSPAGVRDRRACGRARRNARGCGKGAPSPRVPPREHSGFIRPPPGDDAGPADRVGLPARARLRGAGRHLELDGLPGVSMPVHLRPVRHRQGLRSARHHAGRVRRVGVARTRQRRAVRRTKVDYLILAVLGWIALSAVFSIHRPPPSSASTAASRDSSRSSPTRRCTSSRCSSSTASRASVRSRARSSCRVRS